ncbi:MAG: signal peptidase I [Thiohalomonadales bacterium]
MNIDFPAIMVLAVFLTGSIWAIDAFLWAPKRRGMVNALASGGLSDSQLEIEQGKAAQEPVLVEYSRSLFPVILAVLVLRSFMVEPFRIPSGSMMPTLLVGDFILVNKFTYGIRLPVLNTKIIDIGEPKRGDVAVFRFPNDPTIDYIKRVVGLPGDKISYYNKQVYVNGKPYKQDGDNRYEGVGAGISFSGTRIRTENLAGVKHKILIDTQKPITNLDGYVVPEAQYFVMGDNRDNSNDSRYWGMVPEANLVGRAFMVWMNWDSANGGVDWGRIGTAIK